MIQPRARDVRTELKSLFTSASIKGFKIYIQPLSRKGGTGATLRTTALNLSVSQERRFSVYDKRVL